MFFSSVKEINRFWKKKSRCYWVKECQKINLKFTIEKCGVEKSLSPGEFSGSSNSCRYHWIFKLFVANIRGLKGIMTF